MAFLALYTPIVIVSLHSHASWVASVQLSVLRSVAGQTLTVLVACKTVIGAVLASWSWLPLHQQRSQAFLKAGVVSTQVVPLMATSTESRSLARGALRRTSHAYWLTDVEKSFSSNTSWRIGVKCPVISHTVTWWTSCVIRTGQAVIQTSLANIGVVAWIVTLRTLPLIDTGAIWSEVVSGWAGSAEGEGET